MRLSFFSILVYSHCIFVNSDAFRINTHKITEFIQLTRIKKNVIPTTVLTIVGGAVTNPHTWQTWIHSPPFLATLTMTHLLTSGSMIINDLFDIDVDRINNPNRPLVKGTISQNEAIQASILMFGLYCQLGIQFVQPELFPIWSTSLLLVVLYTPVLKKICVIKNITVASVIAMTIPFLGWATKTPAEILVDNSEWMWQTTRMVFIASLYNELLLDISDMKGDAIAGITTLPVLFGKYRTVQFLTLILMISECDNLQKIFLHEHTSNSMFFAIMVTYIPLYVNLWNIHHNHYQKKYIQGAISSSTFTLLLYLLCSNQSCK